MKIKKFNVYSIKENINNVDKIEEFFNRMLEIVDYDNEYEEGDEPSQSDLSSEVGDLMNTMDLTTDDLQNIVNKYTDSIYVDLYVKPQLEYELGENSRITNLDSFLIKSGINDLRKFKSQLEKMGYIIIKNK